MSNFFISNLIEIFLIANCERHFFIGKKANRAITHKINLHFSLSLLKKKLFYDLFKNRKTEKLFYILFKSAVLENDLYKKN